MSACDTLERVANLLDAPERDRFLTTVARCRNIPEDDEYLLVLEAIGFMTLIWDRVPTQVHSILEGAKPASLSTEYLRAQIRESIAESIPSFEDLRQISQSLKQQQAIQNRKTIRNTAEPVPESKSRWIFFCGLLAGVVISLLFHHSSHYLPW